MSVMIPLAGDAAKRAPSGCWLTCAIALECRGVFVWRLRVVSELRVGLAPLLWTVSPPCRVQQPFTLGCVGWCLIGTLGCAQRCA